jgi:hypothetical protein
VPTLKVAEVAQGADLHRAHVIKGVWEGREIHIDDALVTVDMVLERVRDFFVLREGDVAAFAWGPDAPRKEMYALAYGCTEFTVPESWVQSIDAHTSLDVAFIDYLTYLPRADFTLCCSDADLRRAMRRVRRAWRQGVRPIRVPW